MSRIATGTGDKGDTGLFQGPRVPKDDARVEAYGAVDELNAVLGLVGSHPDCRDGAWLGRVQRELFVLGADLATPGSGGVRITAEHVRRLEGEIDALEDAQPPLRRFILPAGDELAARWHLARTVCRRAERRAVTAKRAAADLSGDAIVYLNRLSDLLFLRARARSLETGSETHMDFGNAP